jgi:hypothetical protein
MNVGAGVWRQSRLVLILRADGSSGLGRLSCAREPGRGRTKKPSEARGRGIAARALGALYDAAIEVGLDGVYLNTNWSWQPAVRFYLRLGFWVRNWKHCLLLMRARELCAYRVEIDGARATFVARLGDAWTPLIDAEHRGTILGWSQRAAFESLDDQDSPLVYLAPGTFALHLALRGWPLVRSADLRERRYEWCDMGMPEGLAYKIAVFEAVDREHGFDLRTPLIPGVDYGVGTE